MTEGYNYPSTTAGHTNPYQTPQNVSNPYLDQQQSHSYGQYPGQILAQNIGTQINAVLAEDTRLGVTASSSLYGDVKDVPSPLSDDCKPRHVIFNLYTLQLLCYIGLVGLTPLVLKAWRVFDVSYNIPMFAIFFIVWNWSLGPFFILTTLIPVIARLSKIGGYEDPYVRTQTKGLWSARARFVWHVIKLLLEIAIVVWCFVCGAMAVSSMSGGGDYTWIHQGYAEARACLLCFWNCVLFTIATICQFHVVFDAHRRLEFVNKAAAQQQTY